MSCITRGPVGTLAPTCAMRWCWRLMTRDTAIWILPKTATTSSFLSSKDGAPKFCRGPVQVRLPDWAHLGTQIFPLCVCPRQGHPRPLPEGSEVLWVHGKDIAPLSQLCSTGTHIVLLGASPEVDAPRVAGDVEHSDALQARQRDGHPVALQERAELGGPLPPAQSLCPRPIPPAAPAAPGSCRCAAGVPSCPAPRTTSCSWCGYCRVKQGSERG